MRPQSTAKEQPQNEQQQDDSTNANPTAHSPGSVPVIPATTSKEQDYQNYDDKQNSASFKRSCI
jgi:hypothetical protein